MGTRVCVGVCVCVLDCFENHGNKCGNKISSSLHQSFQDWSMSLQQYRQRDEYYMRRCTKDQGLLCRAGPQWVLPSSGVMGVSFLFPCHKLTVEYFQILLWFWPKCFKIHRQKAGLLPLQWPSATFQHAAAKSARKPARGNGALPALTGKKTSEFWGSAYKDRDLVQQSSSRLLPNCSAVYVCGRQIWMLSISYLGSVSWIGWKTINRLTINRRMYGFHMQVSHYAFERSLLGMF